MQNPSKPKIPSDSEGHFFRTKDGNNIFVYDHTPVQAYEATIFIISGITGINHHKEKEVIEQLSNGKNRVVVIHPRGTGYSDGKRGDISDFSLFIEDYIEIITHNKDYKLIKPTILFGHSMSCAILLAIAEKTEHISGAILVNPPYIRKVSKGMSPGFGEYLKYAAYYIFARHKPIVNMAGNPELIENEEDRKESEARANDPLLVKYFSLHTMLQSQKIMKHMIDYSQKAKYPLLLIYGLSDNIVDEKGCDLIYKNWNNTNKKYYKIENGSHGKSTVRLADEIINDWIDSVETNKKLSMSTLNEYTKPTKLADSNNPIVQQKADELTRNIKTDIEKVQRIYHYIRDEIPYTFTHNLQKASDVLKEKVGQCNTKTTLTIALLRAVKIPARYHCGSVSKTLFKNTIPKWAYPLAPQKIPGHCWPEVFINDRWTAIENVVDLRLYEGIQYKISQGDLEESMGCGLSADTFQKEWDGQTDVLMQEGALLEDVGTFSNADEYLAKSETFLNPIKYWIKNKVVKQTMNKKFDQLRSVIH